jgi:hypothetical protein
VTLIPVKWFFIVTGITNNNRDEKEKEMLLQRILPFIHGTMLRNNSCEVRK